MATLYLKHREEWRAGFSPGAPLEGQLDSPYVPMWQVAYVMGISESSAYESGKRFDAALRAGDNAAAAREVPCVIIGKTHRVPTVAFLEWWRSAGAGTLDRLTQQVAS